MGDAVIIECVISTVIGEHEVFNEVYAFFNEAVEDCRRSGRDVWQIRGYLERCCVQERACIDNVRTQMGVLSQIPINIVESIWPGATQLVQGHYNKMVEMHGYHTRYLGGTTNSDT